MPYGFLVTSSNYKQIFDSKQCLYRKSVGGIEIGYNPLPKFEQDHIFFENEFRFILLDGVIINKKELQFETSDSWDCFFDNMVKNDINGAITSLRGSFRGVIIDKVDFKVTAFTSHCGEKSVYYLDEVESGIIIGSDFGDVLSCLRINKKSITPNKEANYEMLVTGSVLHGNTVVEGILRLQGGCEVTIESGKKSLSRYHIFSNYPEYGGSLEECINTANELYRQAVDRIFSKNSEYDYKQECDLSGGLDSRMATWVAHDLGYENVLNICYGTKGKLDNTISKKIAGDLGNSYFFYPMTHKVLMDVDEKVKINGGISAYFHSTGALNTLKSMDVGNLGIACTGLMGEIQDAYWVEGDSHTKPKYTEYRRSNFIDIDIPDEYSAMYETYEQMNLYELGFSTVWLTTLARQQIVEVCSPVMDVDYLEFVLKIPIKYRKDYRFKQEFILSKYPEAAKYVWQMFRMPVSNHYYNRLYYPKIWADSIRNLKRCINKVNGILHINWRLFLNDDMNNFQSWYTNSSELRAFFQEYYSDNIDLVTDEKLKAEISRMFCGTGIVMDKMLVINLLSIWKNFISAK